MVSHYNMNTRVCVPPIKNSTTEFTSTVKLLQMFLKAPKKLLLKKEGKKKILVVMKKHIAILTQLATFRRHLENYPSTMQRDGSEADLELVLNSNLA